MCHEDNKFHHKTTLVLMVPEKFLEDNNPKTNAMDRKLKDLIDLNPIFIDDWSKVSTKHPLIARTYAHVGNMRDLTQRKSRNDG